MSRKPRPAPAPADTPAGERIAKVLSRAGAASRREAERMIAAGEVTVNGRVIDSPALNVTPADRITVRGEPLAAPEPPRLWLYHKPEGLVTSAADEKGRDTIFDHLPSDLPRVMSVGRLDLNSEGLLLLTNDGELKRRLELPSTGWLRKYRVRIKGNPTDPDLDPLRQGITVDGERFQPMSVVLDRHQGANAWVTVGLREGKNREIRRAMTALGLTVNRLIRIAYGPFRLGELPPGAVEEIRPRVLRDQLGLEEPLEAAKAPAPRAAGAAGQPPRGAAASRPGAKAAPAAKPAAAGAAKPAPRGRAAPRAAVAVPAGMDTQDPARTPRRHATVTRGGRPPKGDAPSTGSNAGTTRGGRPPKGEAPSTGSNVGAARGGRPPKGETSNTGSNAGAARGGRPPKGAAPGTGGTSGPEAGSAGSGAPPVRRGGRPPRAADAPPRPPRAR